MEIISVSTIANTTVHSPLSQYAVLVFRLQYRSPQFSSQHLVHAVPANNAGFSTIASTKRTVAWCKRDRVGHLALLCDWTCAKNIVWILDDNLKTSPNQIANQHSTSMWCTLFTILPFSLFLIFPQSNHKMFPLLHLDNMTNTSMW